MSDLTSEKSIDLPVLVRDSDLEKYPEFKKLLKTLTRYVAEDGTTKEIKQDYTKVKDALRQEKLQYFQAKVVYEELKEIVFDYETNKLAQESEFSTQTYKAMKEALISAEAVDYLDFNPEISGTDVTLLGLKADRLHQSDPNKMLLQQGIIPELENRLKSKCEEIAQYHEPSKSKETDSKFAFAKATQFPALLAEEKSHLQEDKKQRQADRMLMSAQHVQYYQTLVRSLEVTEKLITQYKLEWQTKYDEITSDWLAAKCQAMCLKIRVLQNQLLCDTYSPESVTALKQIRQSLQAKENETKKELHHVMKTLKAYKSIGMGFDDLVELYGDIIAEIDNKKWALTELRHGENNELNDLWK
ncbi:HAUS augmin-like complex subunit 4 [Dendronephthya gigantea]|uniref:HAUS augmin-like complex subunit 4 n=1 Tax=Dendronephthya gigantea TaxID=151771 RepID=UPI00106A24A0|nr:HAUS augmin-like complex subunit 4 [Dendronephthya gigantea]